MQAQNVTRLHQNTVFSSIQSFLRNKGIKSENTQKAYELDIKQFFKYMRNKEIEDLLESDLDFKNSDMMDYQTYLYRDFKQENGKPYSNGTINRKIDSVIALYRSLKRNEYNVDPDKLKVDPLPDDSKQIGFLTVEEIEHMLMLTNDDELKAFIIIALHTSMRKDAILKLKWSQIEQKYDEPDFYIITTIDKNKQDFKEFHVSIYELLLNIKKSDELVFNIPKSSLDYQFKALCKKAGIDKNRKVSIHSLRKAGVDFVKQYTGDIHAAQGQATHSSPAITAAIYTQKPRNLAARLLVDSVDEKIFDELSRDELLKLVKSFGNGLGYNLRKAAKKIVDAR